MLHIHVRKYHYGLQVLRSVALEIVCSYHDMLRRLTLDVLRSAAHPKAPRWLRRNSGVLAFTRVWSSPYNTLNIITTFATSSLKRHNSLCHLFSVDCTCVLRERKGIPFGPAATSSLPEVIYRTKNDSLSAVFPIVPIIPLEQPFTVQATSRKKINKSVGHL